MLLLSIDPGETVGYAWIQKEKDELKLIKADQKPWKDFLSGFHKQVQKQDDFEVLYEQYRIRKTTIAANMNKELITVKIIGAIEWLCDEYGYYCQSQPPGIGDAFFDKQRLKEMDLWIVGKEHARDAIRHGMWHLSFGRDK